mmetsp:Transcript_26588/g.36716  ORF Transcript_26588/g.36716 Transcript_26588/m.36716 type:complete len:124 (+) Transcript_26588:125-496(+)
MASLLNVFPQKRSLYSRSSDMNTRSQKKQQKTSDTYGIRAVPAFSVSHDKQSEESVLLEEDIEDQLKAFDLCQKFGPCVGVSRLERWERAHRFGLQPSSHIREFLLSIESSDPKSHSLWEGRL